MTKKNKMLEKIQKLPSYTNLSSNVIKASEPIAPDKIISSKYQSESPKIAEGATEFDKYSDELASLLESDKSKKINKIGSITKEADDAYKAAKALTGPKKLNVKGSGKFGTLASLLGLGATAFAPESKASRFISEAAKAAESLDPSTYLQEALNDPRNSIEAIREFSKNEKNNKSSELTGEAISNVSKLLKGDSEIRKAAAPILKEISVDSGIRPERAMEMLGEQKTEDVDDMPRIVSYKDYLEKMKKDKGY